MRDNPSSRDQEQYDKKVHYVINVHIQFPIF